MTRYLSYYCHEYAIIFKKTRAGRVRTSRGVCFGKYGETPRFALAAFAGAVRAWVDGLKANKIAWDQVQQKMVDTGLPDHKERRESGRAIVEYVVGKAIERSMEVSGSYKELSTLIEEIKASPEAMRLLPAGLFESLLNSEPFTTEGKESAPGHENEPKSDSEQETS